MTPDVAYYKGQMSKVKITELKPRLTVKLLVSFRKLGSLNQMATLEFDRKLRNSTNSTK